MIYSPRFFANKPIYIFYIESLIKGHLNTRLVDIIIGEPHQVQMISLTSPEILYTCP